MEAISGEEEIQRKIREIEELKSEFISMVSHELRTPMTVIKEASSLLLAKRLPAAKRKKYLGMIVKHVDRLNGLISELLDLSKLEEHKLMLKSERLAFSPLLEEAAKKVAPLMKEKKLVFVSEVEPDLPLVVADKARLTQAILSLMGNAVKYTGRGGKIKLAAYKEGENVVVKIEDNGRGLAPAELEHIFERFYTAEDSLTRSSSGTGLGLPIAKGIVEAMGGRIWGESKGLNQGSAFAFSLPVGGKP